MLIGLAGQLYLTRIADTDPSENATTTPEVGTSAPEELTISQVSEQQIALSDGTTISIDQFADEVEVAEGAVFGSSDRIKEANISPDKKHLAIAIGGAAHDFGWLYDIDTNTLRPVEFQYGGEVRLGAWKSNTQMTLVVTTPEPKTVEKVIDISNLAEYPKAATE